MLEVPFIHNCHLWKLFVLTTDLPIQPSLNHFEALSPRIDVFCTQGWIFSFPLNPIPHLSTKTRRALGTNLLLLKAPKIVVLKIQNGFSVFFGRCRKFCSKVSKLNLLIEKRTKGQKFWPGNQKLKIQRIRFLLSSSKNVFPFISKRNKNKKCSATEPSLLDTPSVATY